MSESNLPVHTGVIQFVEVCTEQGLPVLIPATTLRRLQQTGQTTIAVTLCISGQIAIPTTGEPTAGEWLTIAEAIKQHIQDIDGSSTQSAKSRINRAIKSNTFASKKINGTRLIEPVTFAAWRLEKREQQLTRIDEE